MGLLDYIDVDGLFERWKCRRIVKDSSGKDNPIVLYSFFRHLEAVIKAEGIDIEDYAEENWEQLIDPDLTPEENLRIIVNYLLSKYGRNYMGMAPDYLEDLAASFEEMQQAYEEAFNEYLREEYPGVVPARATEEILREFEREKAKRVERELVEEAEEKRETEKVPSSVELYKEAEIEAEVKPEIPPKVKIIMPMSYSAAWKFFADHAAKEGIPAHAYLKRFKTLWEQIRDKDSADQKAAILELIDQLKTELEYWESLTVEERKEIVEALGLPTSQLELEIVKRLTRGELDRELLEEYKRRTGAYDPCSKLMTSGLISYREYLQCQEVWLG